MVKISTHMMSLVKKMTNKEVVFTLPTKHICFDKYIENYIDQFLKDKKLSLPNSNLIQLKFNIINQFKKGHI